MPHTLLPCTLVLASLVLLVGLAAPLAAAPAAPAVDISPVPANPAALRSALPPHWQHGVFMEIFVRAWRDGDGDGIGDLRGLKDSLPYLQRLGVRGLWLMPITANADGDHGYATTDFRDIAPEYGTLADFDAFIAEAHRRGIGVIMDYVINHSAAQGLVAGWQRRLGKERSLVVINYGETAARVDVPGLAAGERLQALWPAPGRHVVAGASDASGTTGLALRGQSLAVYRILPPARPGARHSPAP